MKKNFIYGIQSIYYSTSLNNVNLFISYKKKSLSNQYLTIINQIDLKSLTLNQFEDQCKLLNSQTKRASFKVPIENLKGLPLSAINLKSSIKTFIKTSNKPFPIIINKLNQKIRKFFQKQILLPNEKKMTLVFLLPKLKTSYILLKRLLSESVYVASGDIYVGRKLHLAPFKKLNKRDLFIATPDPFKLNKTFPEIPLISELYIIKKGFQLFSLSKDNQDFVFQQKMGPLRKAFFSYQTGCLSVNNFRLEKEQKEKKLTILFGKKLKINRFLNNKNNYVFSDLYRKKKSFLELLLETYSKALTLNHLKAPLDHSFTSGKLENLLVSLSFSKARLKRLNKSLNHSYISEKASLKYIINPSFFFFSINIRLFFIRKVILLNLLILINIYNIGGKIWSPNLIANYRFLNKQNLNSRNFNWLLMNKNLRKDSQLFLEFPTEKVRPEASIRSLFLAFLNLKTENLEWLKPWLISKYNLNLVLAYTTFSQKSKAGQKNFIFQPPKNGTLKFFWQPFFPFKKNLISELDWQEVKRKNVLLNNSLVIDIKPILEKKLTKIGRKKFNYSLSKEKKKQSKIIWSWLIKRFSKLSIFLIANRYWLFLSTNYYLKRPLIKNYEGQSFFSKKDLTIIKILKTSYDKKCFVKNVFGLQFLLGKKLINHYLSFSKKNLQKKIITLVSRQSGSRASAPLESLNKNSYKMKLNFANFPLFQNGYGFLQNKKLLVPFFNKKKGRTLLKKSQIHKQNFLLVKNFKEPFLYYTIYKPLEINRIKNDYLNIFMILKKASNMNVSKKSFSKVISSFQPSKTRTEKHLFIQSFYQKFDFKNSQEKNLTFLKRKKIKTNQFPFLRLKRNEIQKISLCAITYYLLTYKQRKSLIKFNIGLNLTKKNFLHSFTKEILPGGFSVLILGDKKSYIEHYSINKRKNLFFHFCFKEDLIYLKPFALTKKFYFNKKIGVFSQLFLKTKTLTKLKFSQTNLLKIENHFFSEFLIKNKKLKITKSNFGFSLNQIFDLTKKEKFYDIWRNQDMNNSFLNFINF